MATTNPLPQQLQPKQFKPPVQEPGENRWTTAHQKKVDAVLPVTLCHILSLFCMGIAYFTTWFTRTPLENLSIYYYMDHASYSVEIAAVDAKISYNKCNEYDGKHCDDMNNLYDITNPLWFTSFAMLSIITIFGLLVMLPHHLYCFKDNHRLLQLSNKNKINYSIAIICIITIIVWSLSVSVVISWVSTFPYIKYCWFEEYDDDNIGCSWDSGLSFGVAANCIVLMTSIFLVTILAFYRRNSNTVASAPNTDLLNEGIVNNMNPQQHVPQYNPYGYNQQPNQNKNPKNFKTMLIFAVSFIAACAYAIVISVIIVPKSDKDAMNYITNEWNDAKCFQPNNKSLEYYTTPTEFSYSSEDVCSFTYVNESNYEVLPSWWSCCTPQTCLNAFNYTDLILPGSGSMSCLHAMSVITKGSCHPLGADFTPKNNNIRMQSNINKQNGIFICGLYCKQIWNDCMDAKLKSNTSVTIGELFTDEMDFCQNGLQIQVRMEIFTYECLDSAYNHFNLYMFLLFMFGAVLFF